MKVAVGNVISFVKNFDVNSVNHAVSLRDKTMETSTSDNILVDMAFSELIQETNDNVHCSCFRSHSIARFNV